MPEHLSCGCNAAPRAGPPVPLLATEATGRHPRDRRGPPQARGTSPDHIPRTRTPRSPTRRSTRSGPSALLRVFRPCKGGVECRYIPVQRRGSHVARATGNWRRKSTDESRGPCRCQAGNSARWTISSGLCATVTRSSRPISASMVSDVAGVSGRWSPASRSFSGGVCPDLVGADLSHYRIYLVGLLLGAMLAVRGPEKGDGVGRSGSSMHRVSKRAGSVCCGLRFAVRPRNPGAGRLVW